MGPSTVKHSGRAKHGVTSECSGGLDQVGAAERVGDGNGETALLLLRRTVVRRKTPSTVTNGEEQGAVRIEGTTEGGRGASRPITVAVDLTDLANM